MFQLAIWQDLKHIEYPACCSQKYHKEIDLKFRCPAVVKDPLEHHFPETMKAQWASMPFACTVKYLYEKRGKSRITESCFVIPWGQKNNTIKWQRAKELLWRLLSFPAKIATAWCEVLLKSKVSTWKKKARQKTFSACHHTHTTAFPTHHTQARCFCLYF
jgi:hypothetical protein